MLIAARIFEFELRAKVKKMASIKKTYDDIDKTKIQKLYQISVTSGK